MSKGSTSRRRSLAVVVVVCISIWAVPLTVAIASWVIATQLEREAVSAPVVDYTTVGERADPDLRQVVVDVRYGSALSVPSGVSGVVTALNASEGESLTDGTAVVSVDGAVMVAYAQVEPQYRPLRRGDAGPDVRALQEFLSAQGLLAADLVDNDFGSVTESAVREYQRAYGHAVDGIFQPSYVLYVGPEFVIDRVSVRVGQFINLGEEIIVGEARAETVALRTPELSSLAPFADSALVLEVGESELSVSSLVIEGESAVNLAHELAETSATPELIEDGSVRRYANARLSLAQPIVLGALPSSALYISDTGISCIFLEGDVVVVDDYRESTTEFGTVLIPREFVGQRVILDAAALSPDIREQCT